MNLQESGEMYLESIFVLSERMEKVRSIDVCEYMGVSKPSVSRAIGLLRTGGYVNMASDGALTLTELGHSVAGKMYDRHRILTDFLVSLGVDREVAAEDACRIEHHISEESFTAIKRHLCPDAQD